MQEISSVLNNFHGQALKGEFWSQPSYFHAAAHTEGVGAVEVFGIFASANPAEAGTNHAMRDLAPALLTSRFKS